MMKNIQYILLTIFIVLGLQPTVVQALERGCHGVIYYETDSIDDVWGETNIYRNTTMPYSIPKEQQLVQIDGNGKCGNKSQANKVCRPKARDAARKCADDIWGSPRNSGKFFEKCISPANAHIREWALGEPLEVKADLTYDIDKTLRYKACCVRHPEALEARVNLYYQSYSSHLSYAHLTGGSARRTGRAKKACRHFQSFGHQVLDCATLSEQGLCGEPYVRDPRTFPKPKPKDPIDSKPPSSSPAEQKRSDQPKAKTSKTTSTTSASHADIQKELDKKKKKNAKNNPTRTNPVDPLIEVQSKLRYRALLNKGQKVQFISQPRLFADFLTYGEQLTTARGMRLMDFETKFVAGGLYYIGLWEKGSGTSLFKQSLPVTDFNKLHKKNKQKGLQLADFELVRKKGAYQVVSLWKAGNTQEQFSPSMDASALKSRNAVLKEKNRYPVDIEVRVEKGEIRYAALWREGKRVQFMPHMTMAAFRATRDELVSRGMKAVDIEFVKKGGEQYITALWTNGEGPTSVSKPRKYEAFKDFIDTKDTLFIEDLEIQIK